jgi:hypothetical protein
MKVLHSYYNSAVAPQAHEIFFLTLWFLKILKTIFRDC